ncbi:MAG: SH3 domain-containing protein, partial [Deltaproteobacteria bacterium]
MRSSLLIFLIVAVLAPSVQAASDVKFPYETVIEADETYVRSGAGTKYYPTAKLRRGDKIVVHRHDPGGWFMIAPPPGSFSWVPAKYVQKTGDRGTITSNKVAARVGSFESDIREVFQRTLAEGDEVHILGEKMLAPETGNGPPELWYRIEPPRGEWRWVMGQAVAPVDRQSD